MAKKKLYTGGIVFSTDANFTPEEKIEHEETLLPHEQLLKVKLDAKHRGGKVVTLIEGFIGTEKDLEQLSKQLKAYCGTGGAVKNNEILVQGNNREKILQWLLKNHYVKSKKI